MVTSETTFLVTTEEPSGLHFAGKTSPKLLAITVVLAETTWNVGKFHNLVCSYATPLH